MKKHKKVTLYLLLAALLAMSGCANGNKENINAKGDLQKGID